jgi:hypothetical protein
VNTSSLTYSDDPDPLPALHYQWQKSDTANGDYTPISSNGQSASYTPVSGDVGKFLKVRVRAQGYSGAIYSDPVGPVDGPPSGPSLGGSVTISGNALIDALLSSNVTGVTFLNDPNAGTGNAATSAILQYNWQSSNTSGGTFGDISSATNGTYTPVGTDKGKYLKLKVTATVASGFSGTLYSNEIGPIEYGITSLATDIAQASPVEAKAAVSSEDAQKQVKYWTTGVIAQKKITVNLIGGKVTSAHSAGADATALVTGTSGALNGWTAAYAAAVSEGDTSFAVVFDGANATGHLAGGAIKVTGGLATIVTGDDDPDGKALWLKGNLGSNAAASGTTVSFTGAPTVGGDIVVPAEIILDTAGYALTMTTHNLTVKGTLNLSAASGAVSSSSGTITVGTGGNTITATGATFTSGGNDGGALDGTTGNITLDVDGGTIALGSNGTIAVAGDAAFTVGGSGKTIALTGATITANGSSGITALLGISGGVATVTLGNGDSIALADGGSIAVAGTSTIALPNTTIGAGEYSAEGSVTIAGVTTADTITIAGGGTALDGLTIGDASDFVALQAQGTAETVFSLTASTNTPLPVLLGSGGITLPKGTGGVGAILGVPATGHVELSGTSGITLGEGAGTVMAKVTFANGAKIGTFTGTNYDSITDLVTGSGGIGICPVSGGDITGDGYGVLTVGTSTVTLSGVASEQTITAASELDESL